MHVAALGSSFAAGPGIPPRANIPAGRSGANYASLLASRVGARLTDLSVSGATLKNVLSQPQVTRIHKKVFEPQVEGVTSDVDVVTITAGGNDVAYIHDIMRDTLNATIWGRVVGFVLSRWLGIPDPGVTVEAEDVRERLVEAIDAIRQKAPRCRILLVEYLTLFGRNTRAGTDVSMDEKQIEKHRGVARMLSEAYRMAAEARSECCKVVTVAELSWEHDIGSVEPWVEGFGFWGLLRGKAPFHPNERGMRAVADVLYQELRHDGEVVE